MSDSRHPPATDTDATPVAPPEAEAPGEVATFHLAVFDDALRCFPLVDGTLVIGRSKRNHLQLHDHLLSRKHCSLTVAAGKLILVDLNSSNGTFVNGVREGTRELRVDDIIELGKTVMVVYDGASWGRGEGLLNLRNPVKAQELVHRLREGGSGVTRVAHGPSMGPPHNGVRPKKGLDDGERAFLRWLEQGESRLLPDLVTDYLTHKLVSLLVRNSLPVRSAFTAVLEEMLRPEFFQKCGTSEELRDLVSNLVRGELSELREDPGIPDEDRGLLEPEEQEDEEDPPSETLDAAAS